MTREETIKVLAVVRSAYPNQKIDNAKLLVEAWYGTLGEYDFQDVIAAARFHIKSNKYFPVPANIVECLGKGRLVYQTPPQMPSITGKVIADPTVCRGYEACPYYELDICGATKEEASICHI